MHLYAFTSFKLGNSELIYLFYGNGRKYNRQQLLKLNYTVILWNLQSLLRAKFVHVVNFEVKILIQPSDTNGTYDASDIFGWSFLGADGSSIFRIEFVPIEGDSDTRQIVLYEGNKK